MLKNISLAALLSVATFMPATSFASDFSAGDEAYVLTEEDGYIILRKAAQVNAKHIKKLYDNTRVEILRCKSETETRSDRAAAGAKGSWCFVKEEDGSVGWVFDRFLISSDEFIANSFEYDDSDDGAEAAAYEISDDFNENEPIFNAPSLILR